MNKQQRRQQTQLLKLINRRALTLYGERVHLQETLVILKQNIPVAISTMESVIISLIDPVRFCLLNRNLPDGAIRFDNRETLNPVSFPGWHSFGDVLCHGPSKSIVGISFSVPKEQKSKAKGLARGLSGSIIEYKEFIEGDASDIYRGHSYDACLEIKWSASLPDRLIEVKTSDILWYPNASRGVNQIPIALGIENIEYLAKSADYDLNAPRTFPFPKMRIEFLND